MSLGFDAAKDDPKLLREMKALPSTSARIRALNEKGFSKGEIVRYLNAHFKEPGRPHDFRYQHVYNVLAQSRTKPRPGGAGDKIGNEALPDRIDLQVDSAGRIVIPAVFRSAMKVGEGDRLMAHIVDGELRLITPDMAIRRAQKWVRETIPEGVSLVDDLLEMRRQEAAGELKDG